MKLVINPVRFYGSLRYFGWHVSIILLLIFSIFFNLLTQLYIYLGGSIEHGRYMGSIILPVKQINLSIIPLLVIVDFFTLVVASVILALILKLIFIKRKITIYRLWQISAFSMITIVFNRLLYLTGFIPGYQIGYFTLIIQIFLILTGLYVILHIKKKYYLMGILVVLFAGIILVIIAQINQSNDKMIPNYNVTVKIGDKLIFSEEDIVSVCYPDECIKSNNCFRDNNQWVCPYYLEVGLSANATRRLYETLHLLSVNKEGQLEYLNESISYYLNGFKMDELDIAAEMKEIYPQNISIAVTGSGDNENEAKDNGLWGVKAVQDSLINQILARFSD